MSSLCRALGALAALAAACPLGASAQICEPTETALALVPLDPPTVYGYDAPAPDPTPFAEAILGVGHVYHDPDEAPTGPPGDNSWLQHVALPLSTSPGYEPTAWIARGWVVAPGRDPRALTIWGLIESGYEERSFMALERRPDGWLLLRYAFEGREPLTAWVPECALDASPAPLVFAPWSEWLLSDGISPLFVRSGLPLALHVEPSEASAILASVTEADVLEPHEVRGGWMRVTLVQPSDYCDPDTMPTRLEGWVRWLTEDRGPQLWYFTRGC
jgi:hypothetical protein